MSAVLAYLDGLPLGPLLMFGGGYIVLLVTVLACFKARRPEARCERCGEPWERTSRGAEFHFCRRRMDLVDP